MSCVQHGIAVFVFSLSYVSTTFAAFTDQVERIYDFSERISLTIDDKSFQFSRCHAESCEKLTPKLPRTKDPAQLQELQRLKWSPFGEQVLAEIQFNAEETATERTPEMVTFGLSLRPQSFNVACSGPVTSMIKDLNSKKEKDKAAYQFAYIGPADSFCRPGNAGTPQDFDALAHEIEQFNKAYLKALSPKAKSLVQEH